MSEPRRLRSALRALLADRSRAGSPLERLCAGAASLLPVDGAAISVTTNPVGLRPLAASDPVTARLDDLQFTLGEGPCCDAARDGRPVLVADLTGPAGRRWPMYTAAVLDAGFRSGYAFPLQIGAIRLGALGLLATAPGGLDRDAVGDALVVADAAALALVDLAAADVAAGIRAAGIRAAQIPAAENPATQIPAAQIPATENPAAGGRSADELSVDAPWTALGMPSESAGMRVEVHQATGMVMVQLGVGLKEALVRLRAYAYAHGQTADEVAREIVTRRLRLDRDMP